jgi:hypothetical protein
MTLRIPVREKNKTPASLSNTSVFVAGVQLRLQKQIARQ